MRQWHVRRLDLRRRDLRRRERWAAVAFGVAVLVALPFVLQTLPGGGATVSARTLLARVQASTGVGWSGYAQAQGGVSIPVGTGSFAGVGDLLGGTTQLRGWWRGTQDWRVDAVSATGENDVHGTRDGVWTWDYEANQARRLTQDGEPLVREPRTDDLVPPSLARRLLSEVSATDVSSLPGERVAGRRTAGLRVHVTDPRSTIRHIDVWALPDDGLPVKIAVYGTAGRPVIESAFLDLTVARPAAATTDPRLYPGAQRRTGDFTDIVADIDRLGRSTPPPSMAGLARRRDLDLGAVGVYGRGVTLLVAVPLNARLSGEVVPALRQAPGVVENAGGISLGAGPLNVQMSPPTGYGARWLLIGTLTKKALGTTAAHLPPAHGFGYVYDR